MSRDSNEELPPLMVDIETVSAYWLLTDYQRGRLDDLHEKAALKDPTLADKTAEDMCSLQPATGHIVSIALYNAAADAGEVLYDGDMQLGTPDENRIAWTTGSEKQIMQRFWRIVHGRRIVTFNGIPFDSPFLVARSMYLGVKPTWRINPKWTERDRHLDLREELSCFGRVKVYSFEFTCQLFGIPSPKKNMDGSMVGQAYQDGRIREIAEYCLEDVKALGKLYAKLEPVLPGWVK